ncbi:MAG: hypothetical protein M1358_03530 [Chloroflexi bacterium]|nr:hypothetical protein [Chloroflexota bacterium]
MSTTVRQCWDIVSEPAATAGGNWPAVFDDGLACPSCEAYLACISCWELGSGLGFCCGNQLDCDACDIYLEHRRDLRALQREWRSTDLRGI